MESKMKIKTKVIEDICCLSMILFAASCAKGFDDNERFSGGVTNAQLESPESITITTLTNSDGSESLKLSWPVVMGAGGYKVNAYNVNDPSNPVAQVTDSVVDGCTMAFVKQEDTNYLVTVQTVGNEKKTIRHLLQLQLYMKVKILPLMLIIQCSTSVKIKNRVLI